MTEETFIKPEGLAALNGRSLFYPSAGSDWSEFLHLFADHVRVFCFVDIAYDFRQELGSPFAQQHLYRLISSEFEGDRTAHMEQRQSKIGRSYRFLKPARLVEVYERTKDGLRLTVIRRRGFGQYGLAELSDQSIGVFVHRGDSPGEAGSNVFFLANRRRDHEPCSNLFDKLTTKLADRALVVSDGSNVQPSFLRKFHNTGMSGAEAFEKLRHGEFSFGAFSWKCVGYSSRRYGPTLVWAISRRDLSAPHFATAR